MSRSLQTGLPALSVCLVLLAAAPPRADAAGARLFKSGPLQVESDGSHLWVVDERASKVARISVADGVTVQSVLPSCAPRGVTVADDGELAWVACTGNDRLVPVIFNGSLSPRASVELPYGSAPVSVALSPDGSLLLATMLRGDAVAVVDAEQGRLLSTLEVPRAPLGIAWAEDGTRAWLTHAYSDGEATRVSEIVFTGTEPSLRASFRLGSQEPQDSAALADPSGFAEGGAVIFRGHLAPLPSAAGRAELWLPSEHHNVNESLPSPDSTIQSAVHRLDLATRSFRSADRRIFTAVDLHDPASPNFEWVRPGWDAGVAGPIDLGFSADGATAYILHENSAEILVVPTDVAPGPVAAAGDPLPELTEIRVGGRPLGMALSPTSDHAYVYESIVGRVWVVDLVTGERLPDDEQLPFSFHSPLLTSLERDGEVLFHGSADPRMSVNEKVSCGSCHPAGEADGLSWAFQHLPFQLGPRGTPTVLGVANTVGAPWNGLGQLHRGGDVTDTGEFMGAFSGVHMGGTGFVEDPGGGGGGGGTGPYGGGGNNDPPTQQGDDDPVVDPTVPTDLMEPRQALSAFTESLTAPGRSPYRPAFNEFSEPAKRGARMFLGGSVHGRDADAACATCHRIDKSFADLAFHDVGSARLDDEVLLRDRTDSLRWVANTPSLIGAFATAPYDDAGRPEYQRQTLEGLLLDFATRPQLPGSQPHGFLDGLSRRQIADLAAFVGSIDVSTDQWEVGGLEDREPPRLVRVAPTSLFRVEAWFSEAVERESAEDPANWRIESLDGVAVPVEAAVLDTVFGDRVTLYTSLPWECGVEDFVVIPGAIRDRAGRTTLGRTNTLDLSDAANRQAFSLTPTLTITLGGSGAENVTVGVHDAGLAGAERPDAKLLGAVPGAAGTPGFVRFDWSAPFQWATGVVEPGRLVSAAIVLQPEFGDTGQTVAARRVLQAWGDATHRDSPTAPTWTRHATGAWNAPGATALGGTGGTPSDYFRAFDRAEAVDATASVQELGEPVRIEGIGLLEAYRFWLEQPLFDFGHSLELAGPDARELGFSSGEWGLGERGPVLELTYALPPQSNLPVPPELSPPGSDSPLLVQRAEGAASLSFEEAPAGRTRYLVFEGAMGAFTSHQPAAELPAGSDTEAVAHEFAAGNRYLLVGLATAEAAGGGCLGSLGDGRVVDPQLGSP